MKERPILFSAAMVRALLAGNKTQTRRVVKNEFKVCSECFAASVPHNVESLVSKDGTPNMAGGLFGTNPYLRVPYCEHTEMCGGRTRCPYGVPGDRLWVREAWGLDPGSCEAEADVMYRATDPAWDNENTGLKWKPSIFMPRKASRITLEITDVRVERVQEVSEEDAIAEGVKMDECGHAIHEGDDIAWGSARGAFAILWDSINAKRGKGWDANPWVWALTFLRVEVSQR